MSSWFIQFLTYDNVNENKNDTIWKTSFAFSEILPIIPQTLGFGPPPELHLYIQHRSFRRWPWRTWISAHPNSITIILYIIHSKCLNLNFPTGTLENPQSSVISFPFSEGFPAPASFLCGANQLKQVSKRPCGELHLIFNRHMLILRQVILLFLIFHLFYNPSSGRKVISFRFNYNLISKENTVVFLFCVLVLAM